MQTSYFQNISYNLKLNAKSSICLTFSTFSTGNNPRRAISTDPCSVVQQIMGKVYHNILTVQKIHPVGWFTSCGLNVWHRCLTGLNCNWQVFFFVLGFFALIHHYKVNKASEVSACWLFKKNLQEVWRRICLLNIKKKYLKNSKRPHIENWVCIVNNNTIFLNSLKPLSVEN